MQIQALAERCAKAINGTPKDIRPTIGILLEPRRDCPHNRRLIASSKKSPVGVFAGQETAGDYYIFSAIDVLAWLVASGLARVEQSVSIETEGE